MLWMRKGTSLQILQRLRVLRKYYDQLYVNKFDNWGEMGTVLEKQITRNVTKREKSQSFYLLSKFNIKF